MTPEGEKRILDRNMSLIYTIYLALIMTVFFACPVRAADLPLPKITVSSCIGAPPDCDYFASGDVAYVGTNLVWRTNTMIARTDAYTGATSRYCVAQLGQKRKLGSCAGGKWRLSGECYQPVGKVWADPAGKWLIHSVGNVSQCAPPHPKPLQILRIDGTTRWSGEIDLPIKPSWVVAFTGNHAYFWPSGSAIVYEVDLAGAALVPAVKLLPTTSQDGIAGATYTLVPIGSGKAELRATYSGVTPTPGGPTPAWTPTTTLPQTPTQASTTTATRTKTPTPCRPPIYDPFGNAHGCDGRLWTATPTRSPVPTVVVTRTSPPTRTPTAASASPSPTATASVTPCVPRPFFPCPPTPALSPTSVPTSTPTSSPTSLPSPSATPTSTLTASPSPSPTMPPATPTTTTPAPTISPSITTTPVPSSTPKKTPTSVGESGCLSSATGISVLTFAAIYAAGRRRRKED